MKIDHPLLYSGPMVKAMRAGIKTETRRVVREKTALEWLDQDGFDPSFVADPDNHLSPYGYKGHYLWVRETFRVKSFVETDSYMAEFREGGGLGDAVIDWDHPDKEILDQCQRFCGMKWHPNIHMPKWAARHWLLNTGLRIERLHDITPEGVAAEGTPGMVCGRYQCRECNGAGRNVTWPSGCPYCEPTGSGDAPISYFKRLWDSLNLKRGYGWDTNPWVWVIQFQKLNCKPELVAA